MKAKAVTPERNLLTLVEYDLLFQEGALESKWNNDLCLYALNILAATTGMRMGELQALQGQSVQEKSLTIEHSWDRKYGLKATKTNRPRIAMLFSQAESALKEVITKHEVSAPDDFVFYGKDKKTPVYYKTISEGFYKALGNSIGIGTRTKETKEAHIPFMETLLQHQHANVDPGRAASAFDRSSDGGNERPLHSAVASAVCECQEKLEEVFGEQGAKRRGSTA